MRGPRLLLLLVPVLAFAASPKKPAEDQARMYRYHDADGSTAISAQLTRQAIYSGYQVLDERGRVLNTVAPAPPEAQAQRRQALAAKRQAAEKARQDKALQRLYGGPEDAERARNRRIEALNLKVSYAQNALGQLQKKRDDEVHDAARAERAGRAVAKGTRDAIDRYNRQIAETQADIKQYHQEMDQVRKQFEPVIGRLKELAVGH